MSILKGIALLALASTAWACSSATPVVVTSHDRDHDNPPADVEGPWDGRRVAYGEEFVITPGEAVGFGDHTPVVRWQNGALDGVVVDVMIQRVPPDTIPSLRLVEGSAVAADKCAITLVRLETGELRKATLKVTCGNAP